MKLLDQDAYHLSIDHMPEKRGPASAHTPFDSIPHGIDRVLNPGSDAAFMSRCRSAGAGGSVVEEDAEEAASTS